MTLRADQRKRFARHLLLAEIGEREQTAMCEARTTCPPGADPGARRVAEVYLARAGVVPLRGATWPEVNPADSQATVQATHARNSAPTEVAVPSEARVRKLAGSPKYYSAAQALVGAFAAVEAIKAIADVGQAGELPMDLRLSEEV